MNITIQGQNFRMKPFDELTGADWRRVIEYFKKAAECPDTLIPSIRAAVAIVAPLSVKAMRSWNDGEVILAAGSVYQHLGTLFAAWNDITSNFQIFGDVLMERMAEIATKARGN